MATDRNIAEALGDLKNNNNLVDSERKRKRKKENGKGWGVSKTKKKAWMFIKNNSCQWLWDPFHGKEKPLQYPSSQEKNTLHEEDISLSNSHIKRRLHKSE